MNFQLKIMLMFAWFANCSLQVTWQPVTQRLYLTITVTPGFIRQLQTHFCTRPKIFPSFLPLFHQRWAARAQQCQSPSLRGSPTFQHLQEGRKAVLCPHRALMPLELVGTEAALEVTLGSCQEWTRPGAAPEKSHWKALQTGDFCKMFPYPVSKITFSGQLLWTCK